MSGPRYAITSADAALDNRLSSTEYRVLAVLGTHTDNKGWCYPSQKSLSEKMGLTRQTISAAINKLKDFGYLRIHARTRPGRGKIGCLYQVVVDLPFAESPSKELPMSENADVGNFHEPSSAKPDIPIEELTTPLERTQKIVMGEGLFGDHKSPSKPTGRRRRAATKGSPEFEAFWLEWSETWRERSDKAKAWEYWQDDVRQWPVELIVRAARRRIAKTRAENHRFLGGAHTFLNGKLEAAIEAVQGAKQRQVWDADAATWVTEP